MKEGNPISKPISTHICIPQKPLKNGLFPIALTLRGCFTPFSVVALASPSGNGRPGAHMTRVVSLGFYRSMDGPARAAPPWVAAARSSTSREALVLKTSSFSSSPSQASGMSASGVDGREEIDTSWVDMSSVLTSDCG